MSGKELHEKREALSNEVLDFNRAYSSLIEEIEAIDWYSQRKDVTTNQELNEILEHNKNEEMEHAVMLLEWIRRNSKEWDEQMRTYLFSKGDILGFEEEDAEAKKGEDLGIHKIK